jgi:hypothetical protein
MLCSTTRHASCPRVGQRLYANAVGSAPSTSSLSENGRCPARPCICVVEIHPQQASSLLCIFAHVATAAAKGRTSRQSIPPSRFEWLVHGCSEPHVGRWRGTVEQSENCSRGWKVAWPSKMHSGFLALPELNILLTYICMQRPCKCVNTMQMRWSKGQLHLTRSFSFHLFKATAHSVFCLLSRGPSLSTYISFQ